MVNLVAVQMTSAPDPETNVDWLENALAQLKPQPDSLIVLPECFACFGASDHAQFAIREPIADGPVMSRIQALAKHWQSIIFAGSLPLNPSQQNADESRFYATCRVIDQAGEVIAHYNKIHLFDVTVNDNTRSYRESNSTIPGEDILVLRLMGLKVGVAICYDIRFSGLFDAMGELDVLVLPSAFTQKTGEAHWHTLIKARAIEKQCFVVAADQTGVHTNGRQTYGHSIIVSPWGEILAEIPTEPGCIQARIDPAHSEKLKQAMPVGEHRKFRSHFVQSS